MGQLYNFNNYIPPVLNEAMLQIKAEQRKINRHIFLLALSGVIINWCFIISAVAVYPVNALFSIACIVYACIAICGGVVVSIVFTEKRRNFPWHPIRLQ